MVCCKLHKNGDDERFIDIGKAKRIWTLPAIHSDVWQLLRLHDMLLSEIQPGDRIIYLGNYIGYGDTPIETITEILTFRRMVLSIPGMIPSDIIYLKGVQEEMWDKLLQLQFAPNPYQVLSYILDNGMETMLTALGCSTEAALRATREGVLGTTRWTNVLREKMRQTSGFNEFFSGLKRAAFNSKESTSAPVLFVNAGIDPTRTLEEQADSFWWSGQNFNEISDTYQHFQKVIRGYDPKHQGVNVNCATASLDAGCGFGGPLISALIDPANGEVEHVVDASLI